MNMFSNDVLRARDLSPNAYVVRPWNKLHKYYNDFDLSRVTQLITKKEKEET